MNVMIKNVVLVVFGLGFIPGIMGQDKNSEVSDYMRSSLYTMIAEDHGFAFAEAQTIKTTFFETPLPEKFNDHNLEKKYRHINLREIRLTQTEINRLLGTKQKKQSMLGKRLKRTLNDVTNVATLGIVDTTSNDKIRAQFLKYFEQNKIANQLVAKWFNQGVYDTITKSAFNMELIKQRGLYNATELDKSIASHSKLGLSLLADAGENLINNTFVVGIRFNYVDKASISNKLGQAANSSGTVFGVVGGTLALASRATNTIGKGYVVQATAFLYQLEWNEEIGGTFYQKYYNEKDLKQFAEDGMFKLKFIGEETAWADVQSTTLSNVSQKDLVQRATVRSIDNAIAKLQREFEVFRTKTPLVTTEPTLTAGIGLKEGVESGDKFEVLEKIQDAETGLISYQRVGVIKAAKRKIWDNRYAADEESEEEQPIKATEFSGGNKKMVPGMLIRQIN
ncbi:hypothetical protein HX004_06500 [Myroides sp. 1354]|uniref:hypothetical protein n=1 Tax=unclassified Myroides TaxID=2642485 RepID=UPI002578AFDB|nr:MULTISPECIES: hypothetical protein [unclassified Myroides]MDM1044712.1 hypothetical protein [Myroides sp. R163-1]MDM1055425.1 hypothetical protein [Myroides sp. 1354]MDM1068722.1 hypothetical protein [Myroides sp. 1372]